MFTNRKTIVRAAVSVTALGLLSVSGFALNITSFADSSKIDVLRQYGGTNSALNQVTESVVNIGRVGAGDGGAWNDETEPAVTGAEQYIHTWILPGARSINSWTVQMNTAPGTIAVEYSTNGGGSWNPWDTQTFTAGNSYGAPTFTPGTVSGVNAIRYVATAGAGLIGNRLRLDELQVFMPASQTVSADAGYNLFTQPGLVSSQATSATSGAWKSPNGGDAGMLHNGVVRFDNELKNQDSPNGITRSFVSYVFSNSLPVTSATWGGSNGQGWQGDWELYTANGSPTNPQALGNSIAALTAGGWTLQYSYTGAGAVGGAPAYDFLLSNPGFWENALVTFDSQFGAMQELELHSNYIPEPASLGLLAFGGLTLLRRRRA